MNLLIFAVSLVLFYVLHSVLASNNVKTFLQNKFISKRFYRLGFNLFALLNLFLVFFFFRKINSPFLFKIEGLQLFGGVLVVVGILLLIAALLQYNLREFTGLQQLKNKSTTTINELKTSGLNSYVRHPLYFATLCLLWGYFLYHPTYLILVTAIISTIYIYVGTKLEEQKLIEDFGEAYKIYQKKVKMLVPYIF